MKSQTEIEMATPIPETEDTGAQVRTRAPLRPVSTSLSSKLISKNVRDGILIVVVVLICICTIFSTFSNSGSQTADSSAKQAAMLRALYKVVNTLGSGVISPLHGEESNNEQTTERFA